MAGGQEGRRAEGQEGRRAGGQEGRRAGGQENTESPAPSSKSAPEEDRNLVPALLCLVLQQIYIKYPAFWHQKKKLFYFYRHKTHLLLAFSYAHKITRSLPE